MKKIIFGAALALVFIFTSAGIAFGDREILRPKDIPEEAIPAEQMPKIELPKFVEGERWEFTATTKQGAAKTSDILEGEFEAVYQAGELEVFEIINGEKTTPTQPSSAARIKRLILPDYIGYLVFPLQVSWEATYPVNPPGARRTYTRTVNYKVVAVKKGVVTIRGEGLIGSSSVAEWIYRYDPGEKCVVESYGDQLVGGGGVKTETKLKKHTLPPVPGGVVLIR